MEIAEECVKPFVQATISQFNYSFGSTFNNLQQGLSITIRPAMLVSLFRFSTEIVNKRGSSGIRDLRSVNRVQVSGVASSRFHRRCHPAGTDTAERAKRIKHNTYYSYDLRQRVTLSTQEAEEPFKC